MACLRMKWDSKQILNKLLVRLLISSSVSFVGEEPSFLSLQRSHCMHRGPVLPSREGYGAGERGEEGEGRRYMGGGRGH